MSSTTDFFSRQHPTATGPSIFNTSSTSLANCLLLQEQLGADQQKAVDDQVHYLTKYAGIMSAYLQHGGAGTEFSESAWTGLLPHLPHLSPSGFTPKTFSQRLPGVEIPSAFLNAIAGFSVAPGPGPTSFASFLAGQGRDIRVNFDDLNFQILSVAIVAGATSRLEINLIQLARHDSAVFTSCNSADSLELSFDYAQCQSEFDYAALANPGERASVDELIRGATVHDVTAAPNFFRATLTRG